MKRQQTLSNVINPLPLSLFGSVDPWPEAVQKQLLVFVKATRQKASYEPVSLIDAILMLRMPTYN